MDLINQNTFLLSQDVGTLINTVTKNQSYKNKWEKNDG